MVGIFIGDRWVGSDTKPYIIGEMSANHKGSLDRALELVERIADAGADAVKLQTYTADTMTIRCDKPDFLIKEGLWQGQTLHALYDAAHTPWAWHDTIIARARDCGLDVFSTPFDKTAVEFLEQFDLPAYKVASFEANDPDLLRAIAATGRPMIVSTGMANLPEIEAVVGLLTEAQVSSFALLHCVSGYPTPAAEANLATISDMQARFDVPVGLSDHTLGNAVAVGAVALGACIIEKHVTLRRADGGPDAAFSLEPDELAQLCDMTLTVSAAIGQIGYDKKPSEEASVVFRRSLYVVEDVEAGTVLSRQNVRSIRPGFGMPPKELPNVLGRRAKTFLERGTALRPGMFD